MDAILLVWWLLYNYIWHSWNFNRGSFCMSRMWVPGQNHIYVWSQLPSTHPNQTILWLFWDYCNIHIAALVSMCHLVVPWAVFTNLSTGGNIQDTSSIGQQEKTSIDEQVAMYIKIPEINYSFVHSVLIWFSLIWQRPNLLVIKIVELNWT